ncbi:RagB/SusD family nutrient uptake outer membrane protein [Flavobacterium notoginsengisoli]|uniref:RagB/SusD family nutrient uptake outer membrane protein n=1 Tax=Flavobacterium notoginsengisoli TaxID=1478199 RepID=UPI00363D2DE9
MRTIIMQISILCTIIMLAGCDSFVEVNLPKSQLTNTAVFESYATADAAMADIYAKIRDSGLLNGSYTGISNQLGNYTDELTAFGGPSNPSIPFFNNTLLASSGNVLAYWNTSYNQIYAANAVIEGLQASKNIEQENKNRLLGEAMFIRALSHFYLVKLFGGIPYIKSTDYRQNSTANRISAEEVYKNIISDLEKAISFLPVNYSSGQRIRPNKYCGKALLARTYLENHSYEQAANESSSVINNTAMYSLPAPNSVFLLNSTETIWQLQSATAGQNTLQGTLFIFDQGPPAFTALSSSLVQSFSEQDLRKINWTKEVKNNGQSWFHAYKYKEQSNTPVSKEYSIIFRTAEQYLIRAEARARIGDLIGAKEDLNKLRTRAGLGNTAAESQDEVLKAVLDERRWELFTESGHRFFDLQRFKKLDAVLSLVKPGWDINDQLLPIPENELNTNPNLRPQNPGY